MSKFVNLLVLLKTEIKQLLAFNASDRKWHMPLAAALASGLPLLIASAWGNMAYGLIVSTGGLVFRYMPDTPMHHRMVMLMSCSFGMLACYTLGVLSHFYPPLIILSLSILTTLVTMVCRFYKIGAAGSLFFIMAAAIGAYSPSALSDVPIRIGLLTIGCLLACLIGFFYSLFSLRTQAPSAVPGLSPHSFDFVVFDSIIIGAFVGLSLLLAQLLQLERPYWVPVSCLAVIQGASLRAVWTKQAQRVVGTALGILVTWALFQLPLNTWSIAVIVTLLVFVIQTLVVRQYALAAMFFTPLAILLAEAAHLDYSSVNAVMAARLFDTILGCLVGLSGALCLYSPVFRAWVGKPVRKFIPERMDSMT